MTWLVVWSSLLFALGLILGSRLGIALEERSAARRRSARREERRAARWLAGVRETRDATVMPYRPPEVAPELPPLALDPVARRLFPGTTAEEWQAHEEQALALASESDEEWMARVFADHHRLNDELGPLDEPPPYAWPAWSLLNADPPTFGEEIQAMIANANAVPSVRWLDRLEGGQ